MSGDIFLSQGDAGKTVRVPDGAVVEVRLPENPTTGYRWGLPDAARAEMVMDRNIPQADPSGAGAASQRIICFRIKGRGAFDMVLDLARPWDETEPPRDRFSIKLVPE